MSCRVAAARACPLSRAPIPIAFLLLLFALPHPTAAQPTSGDFFPLAPSAAAFDPAAALSATTDAATHRDAPAAVFSGLAERVQVDQLLGQATTRVVIQVPAGRKGMTPDVALTY